MNDNDRIGNMPIQVDHIVALVEARIDERRKRFRRWMIATLIGMASLGLAGGPRLIDFLEQAGADAGSRAANEAAVVNRLGEFRAAGVFASATLLPLGRRTVPLGDDGESARFTLPPVEASGIYRIEAIATEENVDPVLYLYQLTPTGRAVEMIASNDDAVGLNSRISHELQAEAVYYVEVHELLGKPGMIDLILSRPE